MGRSSRVAPGRRLGRPRRAAVPRGGRARLRRRVGRRYRPGSSTAGGRAALRNFRQASILAVAITSLLLLVLLPADTPVDAAAQQDPAAQPAETTQVELPDTVSVIEDVAVEDLQEATEPEPDAQAVRADTLFRAAQAEALRTARGLWYGFLGNLPKYAVALGVLLLAALAVRVIRPVLRRAFRDWERSSATIALIGIAVWIFAIGVAVSVMAGDVRALVGSLGLVGLALSWALQTPIESFTGWLLNSFQGYFRVGDRVAVGEVFGDVYKIDFLTTTVWEIGSLDRPGYVQAEQPTGRLITFPNSEVLAGSIVNLTRDFPYVWDELTIPIADRSDLAYAADVLNRIATTHIAGYMEEPAARYEAILRRSGLEFSVPRQPQVFIALGESWVNLTARYLVGARERRKWKSELTALVVTEFNEPEHAERIIPVFPRHQIQFIDAEGRARDPASVARG
jgi:small-conductance mechanosensitive channel